MTNAKKPRPAPHVSKAAQAGDRQAYAEASSVRWLPNNLLERFSRPRGCGRPDGVCPGGGRPALPARCCPAGRRCAGHSSLPPCRPYRRPPPPWPLLESATRRIGPPTSRRTPPRASTTRWANADVLGRLPSSEHCRGQLGRHPAGDERGRRCSATAPPLGRFPRRPLPVAPDADRPPGLGRPRRIGRIAPAGRAGAQGGISVTAFWQNLTEGAAATSGTLATFNDSDGNSDEGFTATVDWGDGRGAARDGQRRPGHAPG